MRMETVLITLFMPKCSFLCTRNSRLHLCVEVKHCSGVQSHRVFDRRSLQRMSSVLGVPLGDPKVNSAFFRLPTVLSKNCKHLYNLLIQIMLRFQNGNVKNMTLRHIFLFRLDIWAKFYADFYLVQSHQRLFVKMTALNTNFFPFLSQFPEAKPHFD